MKLDPDELNKLEELVAEWERQTAPGAATGDRAQPLSLSALLAQRRRGLEGRVD